MAKAVALYCNDKICKHHTDLSCTHVTVYEWYACIVSFVQCIAFVVPDRIQKSDAAISIGQHRLAYHPDLVHGLFVEKTLPVSHKLVSLACAYLAVSCANACM